MKGTHYSVRLKGVTCLGAGTKFTLKFKNMSVVGLAFLILCKMPLR